MKIKKNIRLWHCPSAGHPPPLRLTCNWQEIFFWRNKVEEKFPRDQPSNVEIKNNLSLQSPCLRYLLDTLYKNCTELFCYLLPARIYYFISSTVSLRIGVMFILLKVKVHLSYRIIKEYTPVAQVTGSAIFLWHPQISLKLQRRGRGANRRKSCLQLLPLEVSYKLRRIFEFLFFPWYRKWPQKVLIKNCWNCSCFSKVF